MERFFNIEFQYRPVGQGLFYTGVFRHTKSCARFTMAYDCGTKTVRRYIDQEIKNFRRLIHSNDKLDLLIISHFHGDHVNKISDLLNATNGAKYVILPYLSPDELLLRYCINSIGDENPLPPGFYSNPGQYLIEEFNVDNVIYIHGDRSLVDNTEQDDNDPKKPGLNDDFVFNIDNRLEPLENPPEDTSTDDRISHCYDVGSILCSNLWCFKFFNKVIDESQVLAFKADLSNHLQVAEANIVNVTSYINRHGQVALNELNRIYRDNFNNIDFNDTSLVVLHYPVVRLQYDIIKSYILGKPYFPPTYATEGNATQRHGNLLVGDLDINDLALDQMNAKWSNSVRSRAFYNQIPHHGADSYLIPRYFNEFQNGRYYIINYGLGNTHKHPKQSIIDMIQNARGTSIIYSNTQIDHVKIRYRIENFN